MGTQAEVGPLRVVLDTNCVVSALLFEQGRLAMLRHLWQQRAIIPLASQATVMELIRVLGYPRFRLMPEEQESLLADYLPWVEVCAVPPPRSWPGLQDPEDAMFLDLAATASAALLITGDRRLLELRQPSCEFHIITPSALLHRVTAPPPAL